MKFLLSEWLFSIGVGACLLLTAVAPLVLLVLLIRDWRKGELW